MTPVYLRHLPVSGSAAVLRHQLVAVLLALPLSATPALGQANCSIDPQDFSPAIGHAMSAELQATFNAAGASMVLRDAQGVPSPTGKLVILGIGMSTATKKNSQLANLMTGLWASKMQPGVVFVDAARSSQTVEDWNEITDPNWDGATQDVLRKLSDAGVTRFQVALVTAMLTQEYPASHPQMDDADLWGVVGAVHSWLPHAQLQLEAHPFTGYISAGYAGKVPDWMVVEDGQLEKAFVEREQTGTNTLPMMVSFYDNRAQGTIPHPETGLTSNCAADVNAADGHHPTNGNPPNGSNPIGTGAKELGIAMLKVWQVRYPQLVKP